MPAESTVEELQRYVRFGAAEAACLAAFAPRAAPHFPRIAQEFYDRIREHEEAHALLRDEAQIARLRSSLARWLGRLFGGVYDEAHFDETSKIGRVHVKVGLPMRYTFTAIALIRVALARIADEELGLASAPVREALGRLLDLELAVLVDPYRVDLARRLERARER
jgi:truncated hemoglobin YjbI